MSKKDYVLIAAALRESCDDTAPYAAQRQWRADVTSIQIALAADNPRFDCERFLIACGVI